MALHRVSRYARAVLSGRVLAGPLVKLAAERHERDLREAKPKGFIFDARAADHALHFIETWVHLPDTDDGTGRPRLFLLEPWQAFIIGSIFGWRWTKTGYRRFRNAYIEVAKGNGKTPGLAAVGLYGLLMDGQKAPEIYAVASDRDQAMIMYRDAIRMIDASPELSKRIRKAGIEHVTNLSYGMGFFRPFTREQGSKSGTRPHMGLIDELHEHPNGDIVNKVRAGAKGNPEALFAEITNSGFDRTSICWQHHEHSERILQRVVEDERWFAFVAGLDEGDDPLSDETCWPKANPNLGVSIQREYLRDQVSAAKHIPAETNTVLRLNFCVWTQAITRFLDPAQWRACTGTLAASDLVGAACYAGLDLGQSDDFTAFVLVWVLKDGRLWVVPRFWLPSGALERYPHRPYDEWRRAGALQVLPNTDVIEYETVQREVLALCRAHSVRELGYDKRFAEQMAQNLTGAGVTMVNTPQGYALNEALRLLGTSVATGQLVHDGNPVLGWMAANLVTKTDGEVMRPDKRNAKEKIDGAVALLNALDIIRRQAQTKPAEPQLLIFGGR